MLAPSHRVADVRVDVVLDVLQHFVEVAGACRTQEASVAISLSTHTQTYTRLQQLTLSSSLSPSSRFRRHSRNQPITRLARQVTSPSATTSDATIRQRIMLFRQLLLYYDVKSM